MTIAVIDCYDSFTFNLVHYLQQLCEHVDVFRNDEVDINSLSKYEGIVLSPGPGLPAETKNILDIIHRYYKTKPILGICLGHQAIGQYMGIELKNLSTPLHGVKVPVEIIDPQEPLFYNIPSPIETGRYHSWTIPLLEEHRDLKVTASDAFGYAMAISHRQFPMKGLQFHPESVLTPYGFEILKNWVTYVGQY
jgi:anthranilate synthase component II